MTMVCYNIIQTGNKNKTYLEALVFNFLVPTDQILSKYLQIEFVKIEVKSVFHRSYDIFKCFYHQYIKFNTARKTNVNMRMKRSFMYCKEKFFGV